jgi:predicted amidohydrolase
LQAAIKGSESSLRLAALTLSGINLSSPAEYCLSLKKTLLETEADLAVLPAYSSLLLAFSSGRYDESPAFCDLLNEMPPRLEQWNEEFLSLHSELAAELGLYLVPGTYLEVCNQNIYHCACCFNPEGRVIAVQRQTHLNREERELGFSRGEELKLFKVGELKVGLLIGCDARHPETGRLLALQGADLVLHCGALDAGVNCWSQAAGIWAQVQQNQFWAVEAPLCASMAGRIFAAAPIIHGPCEITQDKSGYLCRRYPGDPYAAGNINEAARQALKKRYPLLGLLNPHAYGALEHS